MVTGQGSGQSQKNDGEHDQKGPAPCQPGKHQIPTRLAHSPRTLQNRGVSLST